MRNDRIPRIDIRTPKTLQQLARILNLDIGEVSKLAEGVLKIDRKRARDRKLMLSIEQCEQLTGTILRAATDAIGTTPDGPAGTASGRKARAQPPNQEGRMVFRKDSPAKRVDLMYPEMRHPLEVHPDISERLRGWTHLYRPLGIVLQHLAAHGRSTVVKGCANENKGWRRSPLGGNNGMQSTCGGRRARRNQWRLKLFHWWDHALPDAHLAMMSCTSPPFTTSRSSAATSAVTPSSRSKRSWRPWRRVRCTRSRM